MGRHDGATYATRIGTMVGAVALFGLAVMVDRRSIAAGALKSAGTSMYTMFGGDLADLEKLPSECEACEGCLTSELEQDYSFGDVNNVTLAPTFEENWVVVWTEATMQQSFVWVMQHENVGILAYVLLDTTGKAEGVTLHSNETSVSFVEESGTLYRVQLDGTNLKELVDYCDELGETDCHGLGIDAWDYTQKLYWVDSKLGYLMSCNYDGSNLQIMVDGIIDAYGVAVDKKAGNVYYTDNGALRYVRYDATPSVQTKAYLTPAYPVTNLAVDSEKRYVYWTGDDAVHRNTIYGDAPEIVYSDTKGANSVAIDWQQDNVFYTCDDGVFVGDLDGDEPASAVAYLYNTSFIQALYEITPTPAPTSVPTQLPTTVPSKIPTPAPSEKPSSMPTPVPSTLPTIAPTSVPSSTPTSTPTSVPSPVPTTTPTSVPSSVPTSQPSSVPTPAPTSSPTTVPTLAPTTTCQWYYGECNLCECAAP